VEKFSRTKPLRDKLVLHILVMYLIVENFEVSASKVASDLSMAEGRISPLFKQVGCAVSKKYKAQQGSSSGGDEKAQKKTGGNTELVAQLTVPLKFPAVKKGPLKR